MNPIFRAASETAQGGWLMGIMTVLFLGVFLAWSWYAWAPSNRQLMRDAAKLPFDDEGGEA